MVSSHFPMPNGVCDDFEPQKVEPIGLNVGNFNWDILAVRKVRS